MTQSTVEFSKTYAVDIVKTQPVRVLHVDDDAGFLRTAKPILERQGAFQVDTASSVEEAMEKMKKEEYDVVVSDYQMPGKDGLQFLKELREKGNSIPFIVFTGKGREEIAIKALNLGAHGYFNKMGSPETVYGELAHGIHQTVERKRAIEALLESESKLRKLLENLPQKIFFKNENSVYISCNENYARDLKIKSDEIAGRTDYDFYPKGLAEKYRADDKRIMTSGNAEDLEEEYVQDGHKAFVHTAKTPIKDEKGNVVGILGIFWDITERKKAEEKRRESEQKFRCLVEETATYVGIIDLKGQLTYVNKALADSLGYSLQELTGHPFKEFLHPDDRGKVTRLFLKNILLRRRPQDLEFRVIRKDGHVLHWMAKPTRFAIEDKTVGFQAIIIDITERRKVEQELKESEEKYRRLVELAPDGIVAVNMEGIITSANRSFLTLIGYGSEEVVGKPFTELKSNQVEDIPRFQGMFMSLIEGESPSPVEFLYVRKDGSSRWAEVHPSLLIKDGNPVGAQVIMRDVTERKNAERLIQESQQKFEQLFISTPEAAVYVDQNERVLNVSPRFTMLFGYSLDEVKGKFLDDFLVPEDKKQEALMLAQKGKEGYVYHETVRKNKKGILIPVSLSSAPIMLQDQHLGGMVLYKDITERKQMEERLRGSEERLRSIVENSSDQIFMLDRDCRFLSANRAAAALFGMSPQEMVGRSISEIFPEAIAAQFSRNIKNVFDTGKSLLTDEKAVVQGRDLYFNTSLNPVRDNDGGVIAVTGIVRDFTERKKMEEETSRVLHDLGKRVRELNCLYGMSRLVEKSDTSQDDVLQGTADLLPPAMNCPDITCVRIVVGDREFSTKNFKETRWKLQADIEAHGKKAGYVEMCYLEERPTIDKGPFLQEERLLIDAVAERLGRIIERMKAEKMLQESEERFGAIFEGANDGILVADAKTRRFCFANSRICEISGYSLEELLKLGVSDLHLKKDLPYVIDSFEKQVQGKIALSKDIPVLRKDERVVYCDVNSRPMKIGGQDCLVGIFRDITELKKTRDALKDAREKWVSLTDNTNDIVMIVDSEGVIQFINRTIPPYTPEETIGKTVYEYVPREQHNAMRSSLKTTFEKGVPEDFVVSSNIPKIGTVWFRTKTIPVKHDAKTVNAILMSTDITELRKAEERLKEVNKKLEATNEKLHVVGGLTRHDVRNKLTAVTGNAYLLRQKLTEDPKVLEQLNDMEAAVRLVERIFEFASNYEKLGVEELAYMDVGKAVEGGVSLFSDLKGVKVVNGCGGLIVLADSLLRQLFYNLIDNSLKHGEKTRQIKIHYNTLNTDQLELVYEDDGVGIPDSMRSSLFKESFTSGKGTGYGLFMIKRICEVYGWAIAETGVPGKGAKFTITMPKLKRALKGGGNDSANQHTNC